MFTYLGKFRGYPFQLIRDHFYYNSLGGARVVPVRVGEMVGGLERWVEDKSWCWRGEKGEAVGRVRGGVLARKAYRGFPLSCHEGALFFIRLMSSWRCMFWFCTLVPSQEDARWSTDVNLPSLDLNLWFVRRWVAGSDVTRCLRGGLRSCKQLVLHFPIVLFGIILPFERYRGYNFCQ